MPASQSVNAEPALLVCIPSGPATGQPKCEARGTGDCDRNCESLQQTVATLSDLSLLLKPRDGMLFMFMAERKQGTCEHIEGLSKGRANRGLPVALKLVPNLRRDAGWRLLSFPPEHFTLRPPFHVFA